MKKLPQFELDLIFHRVKLNMESKTSA